MNASITPKYLTNIELPYYFDISIIVFICQQHKDVFVYV